MPRLSEWKRFVELRWRSATTAAAILFILANVPAGASAVCNNVPVAARHIERTRSVTVDPSGNMRTVIHERVKILSMAGAEAFKVVSFPSNPPFQQSIVIGAWKESPDGNKSTATRSESRHWVADSASTINVEFEGLLPGDLVDYRIEIRQDSIVPGHFWNVFIPATEEPVDHAEFSIELPAAVPLHFQLFNLTGSPSVTKQGASARYSFIFRDVAPDNCDGEPRGKVFVTTAGSWDQVAAWAGNVYLGRASLGAEGNRKVKALVAGLTDEEAKIKTLAAFVGSTIAYGNLAQTRSPYEPFPAEEVLQSRQGDCKDMAVLLVGLLRAAGIKAYPALARRHPERPLNEEPPSPYYFDHAVVVLPDGRGEYRWLDPTAMGCEPTAPPLDCAALILKDSGYDLRTYSPQLRHD